MKVKDAKIGDVIGYVGRPQRWVVINPNSTNFTIVLKNSNDEKCVYVMLIKDEDEYNSKNPTLGAFLSEEEVVVFGRFVDCYQCDM